MVIDKSLRRDGETLLRLCLSCRLRSGRELQHGRTLAFDKVREQHHLAVRKLECVVMCERRVGVDLAEARKRMAAVDDAGDGSLYFTGSTNAISVPGSTQQATCSSPTGEKPRLIVPRKADVVMTSSTFAGRDATWDNE